MNTKTKTMRLGWLNRIPIIIGARFNITEPKEDVMNSMLIKRVAMVVVFGIVVATFGLLGGASPPPGVAYADDDVEFEAVDDLTVSGTAGTKNDADLEVKGVTALAGDTFIERGVVAGPYGGLGAYGNLLTYSEVFDNAAWTKTNVTAPTADQIASPYGTNIAEALAPSAANANVKQTSSTAAAASTAYTFSVWLKAASGTKAIVLTVGDSASNNTSSVTLTANWQRFSVTYTSGGSPSGNVFTQIGDDTWDADTIHAWGAQLEQASTPGVYVRTAGSVFTAARGGNVVGDFNVTGSFYQNGSEFTGGYWTQDGTDLYYTDGNVGIGTTNPTDTLHVQGPGLFTSGVHVGADADANLVSTASAGSSSTALYIGNQRITTEDIDSTGMSNPMTTLGDVVYGGASGTPTRLGGSAGFLKSTGASAPAWSSVTKSDVGLGSVDDVQQMPLSYLDTTTTLGTADDKVSSQNAVKVYVDNSIAGLKWKSSVRAATTADGAIATAFDNGSVIDGVTLATNDRILIKNQGTGSQNGIYVVQASGEPSRATDADGNTEVKQMAVFIEEGTLNADTAWVLSNDDAAITLGTTSLTFAQFAGNQAYQAGDGISFSGNQINVDVSDFAGTGLEDDGSENLRIAAAAAGDGLAGGAGSALSVNVDDTTIEISTDTLQVKQSGIDHGSISGLTDDDHTQYALLAGRAGGQAMTGGTASGDDLTLDSTSNGTKGYVLLNPSGGNVGIGTTSPGKLLDVAGDGRVQDTLYLGTGGTYRVTSSGVSYLGTVNCQASGSAANPSLQISTNGLYYGGVGIMNVSTAGNFTATFNNGNVGIGTTEPTARLQVKGAGNDSSTNSLIVEDSDGTDMLLVSDEGQITTGKSTTLTAAEIWGRLDISGSITAGANIANQVGAVNADVGIFGSTYYFGNFVAGYFSAGNRNSNVNNVLTGIKGEARNNLAGARAATMIGGQFSALTNDQTGGTVTTLTGMKATATIGTAGVTVTNAKGIDIADMTNAGTMTNTYGLYIGDVTAGTQTNQAYSLYSSDASAFNYFAGSVGIGTTNPSVALSVGATEPFKVTSAGAVTAVTIDTGQGANELYDMDQNVLTTSAPTFAGITSTKVNAASGSADSVTLSGTLGIMNGSDTFRGLYLNYTNANHTSTGNSVLGMDVATITGDADAQEDAIRIGDGWDSQIAFLESGTTPTYYTRIKAGDQTAASDITYTLPVALPSADGKALKSTTAGVLSWGDTGVNDATYITQSANATLTAEQSLGALTTGLLKNTVDAGVGTLSTAQAGTDYMDPSTDDWVNETGDTMTGALTINDNDGVDDENQLIVGDADDLDNLIVYGNVGIGTTGPGSKLTVQHNDAFSTAYNTLNDNILLTRDEAAAQGSYIGSIGFSHLANLGSERMASIAAVQSGSDANQVGFSFLTHPSATGSDAMEEKVRIDHTGNVGIGTTSPAGLLDISKAVSGTPSTTGKYLSISASTLTDNATAASGTLASAVFNSIAAPTLAATNATVTTTNAATFYIAGAPTAGTNETITNPYALWVDAGNVKLDGNLAVDGTISGTIAAAGGWTDNAGNVYLTTGTDVVGIGDSTPDASLEIVNDGSGDSFLVADTNDGDTTPFVIQSDGDVGIGTTAPGRKLDIRDGYFALTDAGVTHGITYASAYGTSEFGVLARAYTNEGGSAITGLTERKTDAILLTGLSLSGGADSGLGVVRLNAKHGDSDSFDALADATKLLTIENNGTAKVTVLGSGSVGIGTTGPNVLGYERALTVDAPASGRAFVEIRGDRTTDGVVSGLSFHNVQSTQAYDWIASIEASRAGDNEAGSLLLTTYTAAGARNTGVTIDSTGSVGIGTTAPSEKLQVAGTFEAQYYKLPKQFYGQYNDLANRIVSTAAFQGWSDAFQSKTISDLEYWDGEGWVVWAGKDATPLFSGNRTVGFTVPTDRPKFRVTVNSGAWFGGGLLNIYQEYAATHKGYDFIVERSADKITWYSVDSGTVANNTYQAYIANLPHVVDGYFRVTLDFGTLTVAQNLVWIRALTSRLSYGIRQGLPLSTSYDKTITMEGRLVAQGTGNSSFAGNVGIGTTVPSALLSVGSTEAFKVTSAGAVTSASINTGLGAVECQAVNYIDLTPEFPTAVLSGSGNGIMTAGFDATNYHNYYNWTGNSSNQTYDVVLRVLVPEDFSTWDSSAAITFYTNIDATPGATGVTLTVYGTNNTQDAGYTPTKIQTAGWAANTIGSASLTGTYADGGYMTLKFTMTGDSGKNAKLGEVKLKYNRE